MSTSGELPPLAKVAKDIGLIDQVRLANPEFEHLSDIAVQRTLAAVGSESKCLTLGVLGTRGRMDSPELEAAFRKFEETSSLATPLDFSRSYFTATARQEAKHGAVKITSGATDIKKYELTTYGYLLPYPFAGHVADWEVEHNVNLKQFWAEPREIKHNEVSGTLAILSLFTRLLDGPMSEDDITQFIASEVAPDHAPAIQGRWLRKFAKNKFIQVDRNDRLCIKPERLEAVAQLMSYIAKLATLDPNFLREGYAKMDDVLSDPTEVIMLLQRVNHQSKKKPERRIDYSRFAKPIQNLIDGNGGSVTMSTVMDSFPALSPEQGVRLRRALRLGRLAGTEVIHNGDTDIRDLSGYLVVSSTSA